MIRNNLEAKKTVPFLLMLMISVPGAYAQEADEMADPAQTEEEESAVAEEENTTAREKSSAVKNESASFSDTEISRELEKIESAIAKFKAMGVGVAPYEQAASDVRAHLAKHENEQAAALLGRLKQSLADQQRRFYANKIAVWHKQKELLRQQLKQQAKEQGDRPPANNGASLSKGTHSVLSKTKTDYTPLIYPIAR